MVILVLVTGVSGCVHDPESRCWLCCLARNRVCERSEVGYVVGFARNPVTERKIADLLERARLQFIQTGQKARLCEDVYYAAARWEAPRRLVMKAEWLPVIHDAALGLIWVFL